MFTNINLIKILLKKNACSVCAEIRMKTKIHKNFIRSNCYVNELIHNDLTEFFDFNMCGAKYYISFLNDWFKRFEIFFLNRKSDVFKVFESYKKIHEHEKCRIRRLRNDDENEYNNYVFHERFFEKNIQWKFIIFDNLQQNDVLKCFNQILWCTVKIMLTMIKLNRRWWSKLFIIVNYFRNRVFVAGRNIISFKVWTGSSSSLFHIRSIDKFEYALNRKFFIDWNKKGARDFLIMFINF